MRWSDLPGWRRATTAERIDLIRHAIVDDRSRTGAIAPDGIARVDGQFSHDGQTYLCGVADGGRCVQLIGGLDAPTRPAQREVWPREGFASAVLAHLAYREPARVVRQIDAAVRPGALRAAEEAELSFDFMRDQVRGLDPVARFPVELFLGSLLGVNRELRRIVAEHYDLLTLGADASDATMDWGQVLTQVGSVAEALHEHLAERAREDPVGLATQLANLRRDILSTLLGLDEIALEYEAAARAAHDGDAMETQARYTAAGIKLLGLVLILSTLTRSLRSAPGIVEGLTDVERKLRRRNPWQAPDAPPQPAPRVPAAPPASAAPGAAAARVPPTARRIRDVTNGLLEVVRRATGADVSHEHARIRRMLQRGVNSGELDAQDIGQLVGELRQLLRGAGSKLHVGRTKRTTEAIVSLLVDRRRFANYRVRVGADAELDLFRNLLRDPTIRRVEGIPNPPAAAGQVPDFRVTYRTRPPWLRGRTEVIDSKFVFSSSDLGGAVRTILYGKVGQLSRHGGGTFVIASVRRDAAAVSEVAAVIGTLRRKGHFNGPEARLVRRIVFTTPGGSVQWTRSNGFRAPRPSPVPPVVLRVPPVAGLGDGGAAPVPDQGTEEPVGSTGGAPLTRPTR